jgi:hypothetical protein
MRNPRASPTMSSNRHALLLWHIPPFLVLNGPDRTTAAAAFWGNVLSKLDSTECLDLL